MTEKSRFWIDPNDCGLATVEAAERQRLEEERRRRAEIERKERAEREAREGAIRKRWREAERKEAEAAERRHKKRLAREAAMKREEDDRKKQALTARPRQEVLPPVPKGAAVGLPDGKVLGLPDLSELEGQIRTAARMLDLKKPEGWLDFLFGRPDHRIEVKTERGQRLAAYISACTAIVLAAGTHQTSVRQVYIDQLIFLRRVAEEHMNLEVVRHRAGLQVAVEDAKAQAEIEKYNADAREHALRGRPQPPPPPPSPSAPAPPAEDPRAKEKARLQAVLDRLTREEKEDREKIAGGKPLSEWTDDMREESKRVTNMYFHAKQKVRNQMEKVL